MRPRPVGPTRFSSRSGPSSPAPFFSWAIVVFSYAALVLTHNIFALIASPLFAGYAALLAWQARSWRVLARGLLALAIGAAVTAYFWAPALAERDLVHSDRLFVAPIFTWYTNFISPAELLAAPHSEDPLLINPSPARGIGLLPVLLGLPALAAALLGLANQTLRAFAKPTPRVSRETDKTLAATHSHASRHTPTDALSPTLPHAHTLFFAAVLLGYSLLTLPISTPIWRLITPLALVQFPWRMLGPAALCAAVLIGLSTAKSRPGSRRGARHCGWRLGWRQRPWWPWWASSISATWAGGIRAFCASSPTADVADMVQFEIDSHTVGTTAKGEYIPLTAGGVPDDLSLAQAILQGQEPSRLSLPAGATVTTASVADPLNARYQIAATQPVTATYRQFYYPGWQVRIDGQAVPAAPDASTGLIVFQLPAGAHQVQVTFGSTPLRTVAVAFSLVTLLGLAVWGLVTIMAQSRKPTPLLTPAPGRPALSRWARGVESHLTNYQLPITNYQLLFLLSFVIVKFAVVDRVPNPLRTTLFDPATVAPVAGARIGQTALVNDFDGGMRLLGYDLSQTTLAGDGALDVALYMARSTASQARYWPSFDLVDGAGLTWQDPNYLPPRWQREPPGTPLWPLDQYAQWARHISPLPGTPPGSYTLYGSVFDLDNQQIASVLDAAGNAIAPRFALGTVTVGRPSQPFALTPPRAAPHDFAAIALLGYDLDKTAANAGDTVRLSLFWHSLAATPQEQSAQISFIGANGQTAFQVSVAPVNGLPTSQWQPGDEWRGQALMRLPADLPEGDYTLSVALSGAAGDAPLGAALLGRVHVSVPARSFVRPTVAVPNGAEFSGVGVLEGYDLTRTATSLGLDLIWRATATPLAGYSVFVHLQAADGRVWAQSDAAPANWTRPTTGWLPGEYVIDTHMLNLPADLPPGTYTLWTGLYNPTDGMRVPVSGPGAAADQRVAIGQVIIP